MFTIHLIQGFNSIHICNMVWRFMIGPMIGPLSVSLLYVPSLTLTHSLTHTHTQKIMNVCVCIPLLSISVGIHHYKVIIGQPTTRRHVPTAYSIGTITNSGRPFFCLLKLASASYHFTTYNYAHSTPVSPTVVVIVVVATAAKVYYCGRQVFTCFPRFSFYYLPRSLCIFVSGHILLYFNLLLIVSIITVTVFKSCTVVVW
ncbi:hypothetical protein BDF19DRAFT_1577 [Syncephalis fuscata]|nr:hypothetical protein BDF19DRAFT_1577 [Syncephalis fuscata]